MAPEAKRIAMWSGPRNISTAMMRAWENRADTTVIDEPLYAAYLNQTGLDHPGTREIIASGETDWRVVTQMLLGSIPGDKEIWYQKLLTHQLLPEMGVDWVFGLTNCFLIRSPREVIISYIKVRPEPTQADLGFVQQIDLFDQVRRQTGKTPPVLDARDVLENPRRMLSLLCEAVGVPFSQTMLRWPQGRRTTDGIWAKHWYAAVERSTCFQPYRPKDDQVPAHLQSLLADCEAIYEMMYRHRLGQARIGRMATDEWRFPAPDDARPIRSTHLEKQRMLQQFDERNRDLIVNINGRLVHRDQAGISPFDSAVQNGDAVWEGLRVYDGRIFKLIEHLGRLRDSAKALAYAEIPPNEEIIEEIRRTLAANEMTDNAHIRLTLTRGVKYTSGMDPRINTAGPTLIVLAEHKPPVYDKSGLRLITSSVRRIPPECLDQNIHSCNMLNSILAKIQANQAGVDDALMLDLHGFVAETNATHLFIVHDGVVNTSHTHACPEGITRATVLEICRAEKIAHEVKNISLTEVYRADEVFCTGTMGELAPVVEIDGRTIGIGTTGKMTEHLSARYAMRTAEEGYQIV